MRPFAARSDDTGDGPVAQRAHRILRKIVRCRSHHRQIVLIGARRADADREGEREDWAEGAGRIATLLSGIRQLEGAGRAAPTTNWLAALRAEASLAPLPEPDGRGTVCRRRCTATRPVRV